MAVFEYRVTVTAVNALIPGSRLDGPEGTDPPPSSVLAAGESRVYVGLTEAEANVWRSLGEGLPGRAVTNVERIPGQRWSQVARVVGVDLAEKGRG